MKVTTDQVAATTVTAPTSHPTFGGSNKGRLSERYGHALSKSTTKPFGPTLKKGSVAK